MKPNQKKDEKKEQFQVINRQNIDKSYLILYLTVFAVIVLGSAALIYWRQFSILDFLHDILGNLLGILAAFLIFDIFHEKLSRDSYANEMSQKISETLMANPDLLEQFSDTQKENFIHASIASSIKDATTAEMVSDSALRYFRQFRDDGKSLRIRTKFDYKIELYERLPKQYSAFLADVSKYMYVQEILSYDYKCFDIRKDNCSESSVYVGFVYNSYSLDSVLREQERDSVLFNKCIFRETLALTREDTEKFRNLPHEQMKKICADLFKLNLQIDRCVGELTDVFSTAKGIVAKFDVAHNTGSLEHSVRLIFHMPMEWGSVFHVAITDATKAPKITMSYPENSMQVEMYAFLSDGEESSNEVSHEQSNGIFDIAINTEWIYPISGMIFTIKPIGNVAGKT